MYNDTKSAEEINFDHYHFSVAQKYDLTTRRISQKKLKYISDEIFLDLRWRQRSTIHFQSSYLMILFLFFLRVYIHYVGQFAVLQLLEIPVTKFEPHWFWVDMEYASFAFYQDCAVIATGALSNTIVFLCLVCTSWLVRQYLKWWPKYWHKVICWVGIFAIADPLLTLIFDVCYQNWTNGEWFKFYYYFLKTEGNGLVGIYISLFMVLTVTALTGYFFYRYMVFQYMNGRILDLYRRLAGQYKSFFLPLDNEVSFKYMQWVIERAKKRDFVILSERRTIKDKFGIDRMVNFVQIMKIEQGTLKKSRMFFKDYDGSLIEVPQRKILLQSAELKKVKMKRRDEDADMFGSQEVSFNQLIK